MMDELQEAAKELLKDENAPAMKVISKLTNVGIIATKEIVKEMSETPKVSEQAINHLWSDKTSNDLKIYKSGYEEGRATGYEEGKKAGMLKGGIGGSAATAAAVALMAAGRYLLTQNKKK